MALTREQIEARISTLQGGLAKLEAGTTFADRGVTYVSTEQLLARIRYWQGELQALAGRSKQIMIVASKGF